MKQRNKKRAGLPKPNPYILMTGAVAASAAAMTMGGGEEAAADHSGFDNYKMTREDYLRGVDGLNPYHQPVGGGGGKMYSDKASGRPCYGLPEPNLSICYMTLSLDKSGGAESGAYSSATDGGSADWNDERTTVYLAAVAFDVANDVHMKTADTAGLGNEFASAITFHYDYHHMQNGVCDAGDCNDPDGIAEHQPQRWWYAYVCMDTGTGAGNRFLNKPTGSPPYYEATTPAERNTIVAHELGHALGLADYPEYLDANNNGNVNEARPCASGYPTIMNYSCGFPVHPFALDECMINHALFFPPLMYGDSLDANGNSYAYVGCP